MLAAMRIRDAEPTDWPAIWPFFSAIVAAGETYSYPRDLNADDGRDLWMLRSPGRTVVAVDDSAAVLGTAKMNPNQLGGGGAHVASASFMVDPAAGGRGVGRALGEEALAWARRAGYRAMQFNAVVETNTTAVRLWQALGFEIVGTVPEGFRLPSGEYVGFHVMYRRL
jgi:L-amino acid N-acyltransferase YncA